MAYDRLYPFGAERDDMHTANIVRQIAFGALSEPSAKLSDYLTYSGYDDYVRDVVETADSIADEQKAVMTNLDLMFG